MGFFEGHVVAITGAGGGLGRSLALGLARGGVQGLALCDLGEGALAETAALCRAERACGEVTTHVVDVTVLADVERFVSETTTLHGGCSVLVNNAGIVSLATWEEDTKAAFDKVMDVNFAAVVNCTRAFWPALRCAGEKSAGAGVGTTKSAAAAHVVNISSMFGYFVHDNNISYHASKFAVRGFSEALRHECATSGSNVRVHTVHPGFVRTALMRNAAMPGKAVNRAEVEGLFDVIGLTTAQQAADCILAGVAGGQGRIRVGTDAVLLDWLTRIMPASYVDGRLRGPLLALVAWNSFLAAKVRDLLGLGETTAVVATLGAQVAALSHLRAQLSKL